MKDDIAIARGVKLRKIIELAKERLGIDGDDLEPYGHYKAKLSDALIARVQSRPDGKLMLVTAIIADAGGRRQDHDDRRARRRAQPHRQEGDDLPARAVARARCSA